MEVRYLELLTLAKALMRSVLLESGTKTTINSVLMSSPHISQSFVDIFIIASPNDVAWQEEDKRNVL